MMIRPFLDKMTISEMHAMMTGGFATIAGGLFGAYVGFGVSYFKFTTCLIFPEQSHVYGHVYKIHTNSKIENGWCEV